MKNREDKYLSYLAISLWVIAFIYLASVILFLVLAFLGQEDFNNNIFELIYMGVHTVMIATALTFTYKAIKSNKGSYIMKNLMYKEDSNEISKISKGISLGLFIVAFIFFVYTILTTFGIGYSFSFTTGDKLIIINASLLVMDVSLFFHFYPNIHEAYIKEAK